MDPILLEKLIEELVSQGWFWKEDEARTMLLELNLMIAKHGYEIGLKPQALTLSATDTTASPTEKGVQCHACGTVYPSIESYDAHLTSEGLCGGGKPSLRDKLMSLRRQAKEAGLKLLDEDEVLKEVGERRAGEPEPDLGF